MDLVMPIPTPKFWLTALYFNVPSSPFFSYYFAILSVQIKYTLVIYQVPHMYQALGMMDEADKNPVAPA